MSGPPRGTHDLAAAVREADHRHALLVPGRPVVVAVSGGADSVALLDALSAYAGEIASELHVAHLDHMMREGSSDDAAYVAGLAHDRGLPVTLRARDVRALAVSSGRGLEDAARTARYELLAEVALRIGAGAVAVGHTADDQAETVLLRLARGAGPDGLAGMRPRAPYPLPRAQLAHLLDGEGDAADDWPPPVVRPLLGVWRDEVTAWLAARGIAWRDDPTNADPRFTRNRIRHRVLPALEEINPRARHALVRAAAIAADDQAVLEAVLDEAWARAAVASPGRVELSLAAWSAQPAAVRRRLLRRGVAFLRDGPLDLGLDHVDAALHLGETGRVGDSLHLPGGLRLERGYDALVLTPATAALPPSRLGDEPRPLALGGTTSLPGGWSITAWTRTVRVGDLGPAGDPWTAVLDADGLADPPSVRARRAGDRIQPTGLGGHHRSLQDLFVDARVPRAERDGWPVVVSGERVRWVPGVRLDARAAARADSRRVLVLTARPPARR